jgi:hypothetical protein
MNSYYLGLDLNLPQNIKILKLKKELGYSGFGLYIDILLKLAQSKDYKINVADYELLAYEFRLEIQDIKIVVENYGLFCIENNCFYCENVIEKMLNLERKKEAGKKAGKASGEARKNKKMNGRSTVVQTVAEQGDIINIINKEDINNSEPDFKELLENLIPELKGYPALHKIIFEILEKPIEDQLPYFEFVLGNKTDITKLRNTKYWKEYFWADYWIYKQDQTKKPKQQQEDPELEAIFNVFK